MAMRRKNLTALGHAVRQALAACETGEPDVKVAALIRQALEYDRITETAPPAELMQGLVALLRRRAGSRPRARTWVAVVATIGTKDRGQNN